MNRRLTNAALLVTVVVLVSTGLVAWLLPESQATPLYDLHRIAGLGLVLALPWKELVARSSLLRRARGRIVSSAVPGILAATALAVTIGLGLAWTLGLVSFDRPFAYSLLNVHVFAGVALLPLTLWHVLRRWEPPRGRDLRSRRAALRLAALAAAAAVLGGVARAFPEGRRVTGSKHAGSFTGNDFPLTIWAFDRVPAIDPAAWRLRPSGAFAAGDALSLAAIGGMSQVELDAIIDCTGGWWSEQTWRGVPVPDVLAALGIAPSARSVTIRSTTGHAWTFTIEDLRSALFATHVGGAPLSAGHGAPVRLVVPGRRGFQWVKWVAEVEAS